MAQEQKPNAPKPQEGKPKASEALNIVRISGRDINGKYSIVGALRHIKGISSTLASAIAMLAERQFGIAESTNIGALEEDKLAQLESIIKDPGRFGVPSFMLNRDKDSDVGGNTHLVGTDLIVKIKQDMDASIKLQSWTGFRRQYGQKVRGQRTRSTGRTGETVGVTKKRIQEEAKKARAAGAAPGGAAKGEAAAPAGAAGPAPAQPAPAAPAQK